MEDTKKLILNEQAQPSDAVAANFVWQQLQPPNQTVSQIASKFNLHPLAANYLVNYLHCDTDAKVTAFLHPNASQLHEANLLHDMDKAVEVIETAIMEGKKICVYGDYDVDGQTSTAIMYETLQTLGADVMYYVPNRFEDGYGPNQKAYQRLIDDGCEVLVTVDNGVAGKDEIKYAKERGVKVVITDHHQLPDELPAADAIVHPQLPRGNHQYPFTGLCGAGVAFKVACALLGEIPQEMLDLVALGTIADIMDLTDENRTLVYFGLKQLENTARPGLVALLKLLDATHVDETTVGYEIAPRLNALGRLKDARAGVELLTTLDEARAASLAKTIDQLNQKRKDLTDEIYQAAMTQLAQNGEHKINVVYGSGWHQGVVGIVAGRLQESTQKPTLVLGINATNGLATGSGRSIPGFDLFAAMNSCKDLYEEFGGHAQACGLTIQAKQLEKLQERLDQYAQDAEIDQIPAPTLPIWGKLAVSEISEQLIEQLHQLAPFGQGNPAPVFAFTNYQLESIKQLSGGKHLALSIQTTTAPKKTLKALAWNVGNAAQKINQGAKRVDFVGELSVNEFRKRRFVQIIIKDLWVHQLPNVATAANTISKAKPEAKASSASTLQVSVVRHPQVAAYHFQPVQAYVVFNAKLAQNLTPNLTNGQQVITATALASTTIKFAQVVVVDLPASLAELHHVLSCLKQQQAVEKIEVWLVGAKKLAQSLVTLPTHAQFAQVYNLMRQFPQVDFVKYRRRVSQKLNLPEIQLNFIYRVFLAANFAKIEDGAVFYCEPTQRVDLTQTSVYQDQQAKQTVWQTIIAPDDEQVGSWLTTQLSQ